MNSEKSKPNCNEFTISKCLEEIYKLDNEISSCKHQLKYPDETKGTRDRTWREKVTSAIDIKQTQRYQLTSRIFYLKSIPEHVRFLEAYFDETFEDYDKTDRMEILDNIKKKNSDLKDFIDNKTF